MLDRGQNYMVIQQGMGLDFPLDGGYAAVTSRVPEPSDYSETGIIHEFTAERTGGSGAMRRYLTSADLALANFENPVIRAAVWHPDATTFTGDLRLLPILNQAGIDGVHWPTTTSSTPVCPGCGRPSYTWTTLASPTPGRGWTSPRRASP